MKKCICIHEIIRLIVMEIKMKMKNRSHSYEVNRCRPRNRHKYSEYKKMSPYDDAYMYQATPKHLLKLNSWKGKLY